MSSVKQKNALRKNVEIDGICFIKNTLRYGVLLPGTLAMDFGTYYYVYYFTSKISTSLTISSWIQSSSFADFRPIDEGLIFVSNANTSSSSSESDAKTGIGSTEITSINAPLLFSVAFA